MRTLIKVSIPVESGNRAVKDNAIGKIMGAFTQEHRPECSYFYPEHGKRTALFVIDLKDSAQIPQIVEPFFLQLDASVEVTPVMNGEDLQKGLQQASAKRS